MVDVPKERAELEAYLRGLAPISGAEFTEQVNTAFLRLVGQLLRDHQQVLLALSSVDLISEEGRLQAIKQQGIAQGRAILLESILDLIIEGSGNDDRH